jgi:N-(2-amino-2-carboxyethyl)-L-glutamate synthase
MDQVDRVAPLQIDNIKTLIHRIGNTPMREISLIIQETTRKIHLKLEGANPCGSIKDRTADSLITDLENRGRLNHQSILIESTSGNLGVALAAIARCKGYKFLAVVDPKISPELLAKMRMLGAEIDMVEELDSTGGYLLSRLARVCTLCASSHQLVWTNQYANPANPRAHFHGTGPEIFRQMQGRIDVLFVPVSTGGTLAGIGRYLRQVSPRTQIMGVDVVGSVVFGTPPGKRLLTGIGSGQQSHFITSDLYDGHILVSDQEAFTSCRRLFYTTGIKVGGSSGAVLAACSRYLEKHPQVDRVVCLCADRGENYESTIYNDSWLAEKGMWSHFASDL